MPESEFSMEALLDVPVVGILRGYPLDIVTKLAELYGDCGFTTLEITINSPDALKTIEKIAKKYPELNVGAGTITLKDELIRAVDSGAQFIVMPVLNDEVISLCVRNRIPVFPGAYTPTEINLAWHLGASAVKVFPASALGPRYIIEVLAPLGNISLLPTGGVSVENIRSFFDAGAIGVGMGSSLFDKKMIREKDWLGLREHFREIKEEIPR